MLTLGFAGYAGSGKDTAAKAEGDIARSLAPRQTPRK